MDKETCPKCRCSEFMVIRDMTSKRIGKCGHERPCPPRSAGLTDWEVGQDLCEISDLIGEKKVDMKQSHPEAHRMLDEVQRVIGDYFNRAHFKSHGFGITSHDECSPPDSKASAE